MYLYGQIRSADLLFFMPFSCLMDVFTCNPSEILVIIFSHFKQDKRQLCRLSQVCHHFHDIIAQSFGLAVVWQLKITNISWDRHTEDFSYCIAEPIRLFMTEQSVYAAFREWTIDCINSMFYLPEIEKYPKRCRSAFNSNGKFVPLPSMSLNDIIACYNISVRLGYNLNVCFTQKTEIVTVPVHH